MERREEAEQTRAKRILYWVAFGFILANAVVLIWAFRGTFAAPDDKPPASHGTPPHSAPP